MGKDLVQRLPKPVAAQPTPAEPSALAIVLGNLPGQLYTLHLFTASDTVSVLIPQILFAVFASLSPTFSGSTQGGPSLGRVALATLWIKLQLLVLCISNQRQAGAFAEDALNKPWRPLPAGRLTPAAARRLLAAAVPVTFVLAVALGNAGETLALFTLNWLYNDLGMADGHWAVRNALNALGITAMGAGAARVVAEEMHGTAGQGPFARWLAVCAAVLLTTIHAQDLYDQDGDRARGRSTLPLDLGDAVARWTLAVTVLAWTLAVPVFFPIFDPAHGALAAAHGAARLELNAAGSYAHGGTTPSVAELRALKASLPTPAPAPDPRASAAAVPVRVMIRPRGPPPPPRPDFVYTAAERAAMAGAIARLQQSGLLDAARGDGFVFGLLAPDGDVDVPGNSALVDLARPFPRAGSAGC
ncbi:hypothetical protein P8C59_002813 [Phyllachora maydis]|uniref:Copper homeostasis protein cutC homolog n=1 Tax=Phyllachora maydis TaxID=1825666 RepID=A0AAD9I061_9PEZI|nr:hypothetical protein P8C59_002813 [Phyllachora maydis]